MSDGCVGSAKVLKFAQSGANVYPSVYPKFYQNGKMGKQMGKHRIEKDSDGETLNRTKLN
jgi:hypothetical protein